MVTSHQGHAAIVAAERARDFASVFTLGGDGTAMEVIDALGRHRHTDWRAARAARAISLRVRSERRGASRTRCWRCSHGDLASVDLGYIPECKRRFAFSSGVGVDARMIDETHPETKRRFGIGAYVHTGVKVGLSRRPFRVRVEVDGSVIEREATSLMVANFGTVLDRLFVLGPGIVQDDGRLDLCVFSPRHAPTSCASHGDSSVATFGATTRSSTAVAVEFRIDCDPPQLYQADGEILGTTPYSVRVEPLAARLLVARRD